MQICLKKYLLKLTDTQVKKTVQPEPAVSKTSIFTLPETQQESD
jgi:hypothetical protein